MFLPKWSFSAGLIASYDSVCYLLEMRSFWGLVAGGWVILLALSLGSPNSSFANEGDEVSPSDAAETSEPGSTDTDEATDAVDTELEGLIDPALAPLVLQMPTPARPSVAASSSRDSLNFVRDIYMRLDTQFIADRRERIRSNLRFGLALEHDGWSIVALAMTGEDFSDRWMVNHQFDGDGEEDLALFLKQLFIQRSFDNGLLVQLGVLPTTLHHSNPLTLEGNGWVEALRLSYQPDFLPGARAEVTVGSLTDIDTPDLFRRDRSLNFAEVLVSHEVLESLWVQAGFEHSFGDSIITASVEHNIRVFENKVLELVASAMYNVDRQEVAWAAEASMDWPIEAIQRDLSTTLSYLRVREEFGQRGDLADDGFFDGHSVVLRTSLPVVDPLIWDNRFVVSRDERPDSQVNFRVETGFRIRFGYSRDEEGSGGDSGGDLPGPSPTEADRVIADYRSGAQTYETCRYELRKRIREDLSGVDESGQDNQPGRSSQPLVSAWYQGVVRTNSGGRTDYEWRQIDLALRSSVQLPCDQGRVVVLINRGLHPLDARFELLKDGQVVRTEETRLTLQEDYRVIRLPLQ
jgi:hypothetical protein